MSFEKLRNGFDKIQDFFTTGEGTSVTYQSRTYTFQRSKPFDNLKFLGSIIKNVVKDAFKTKDEVKTPVTSNDSKSPSNSGAIPQDDTTTITATTSTTTSSIAAPILSPVQSPVQSQSSNTQAVSTATTQYQPIPDLSTQTSPAPATPADFQSIVPASVPVPQPASDSVNQSDAELQEIMVKVNKLAGKTFKPEQFQAAASQLKKIRENQPEARVFAYKGKRGELKVKVYSNLLGEGGSATAYQIDTLFRAHQKSFKTKVYKEPLSNDDVANATIEKGIAVRDQLYSTNPKVVVTGLLPYWKVKSMDKSKTKTAILPLYKGGSVKKLVEHNGLSPDQKNKMVKDTLNGCKYAHSKGVYLTDIKPDNMFVDEKGNVVLADLDSAMIVSKVKSERKRFKKTHFDINNNLYINPAITLDYCNVSEIESFNNKIDSYFENPINKQAELNTISKLENTLGAIDSFALGLSYAEIFLGRVVKEDLAHLQDLKLTPDELQSLKAELITKGATPQTAEVIIGLLNPDPQKRLTVEQAHSMLP
jgi:hypothetical protein